MLFVFITIMLIKICCSKTKPYATSNPSEDNDATEKPQQFNELPNASPEIVVIMAGEQNPSHIASPAPTPTTQLCEEA